MAKDGQFKMFDRQLLSKDSFVWLQNIRSVHRDVIGIARERGPLEFTKCNSFGN